MGKRMGWNTRELPWRSGRLHVEKGEISNGGGKVELVPCHHERAKREGGRRRNCERALGVGCVQMG